MGFIQDSHSLLRSWDGTLVAPCENCGCYVRSDAETGEELLPAERAETCTDPSCDCHAPAALRADGPRGPIEGLVGTPRA